MCFVFCSYLAQIQHTLFRSSSMTDRWHSSGWNWNQRQWVQSRRQWRERSSSVTAPVANAPTAPASSTSRPGGGGPEGTSSAMRNIRHGKAFKNFVRGLQKRLKTFLHQNGGWQNADIDAFLISDCDYEEYVRRRMAKQKKDNEPGPRQVKKDKFLKVAAHIQRCSLLAQRSRTELKPELDLAMVRDDKLWIAWLEEHGIEIKAEAAEPPPEEAASASTTVAATAATAEPPAPTEEEEEVVQEEGSQEIALTKLACVKMDSDSDEERPSPDPTSAKEKKC